MKTNSRLARNRSHRFPSGLLTKGGFFQIRHPRYVEVVLGLFGCAAIANYLGAYVLMVLFPVGLFLVVLLEERELRERFGAVYETCARCVPPFVRANIQRPWRTTPRLTGQEKETMKTTLNAN